MSLMLFEAPDCVFIRIRKTGSTSIVNGRLGGRSAAAEVVTGGAWQNRFDGRFAFAFVRNPFARLVSCLRMFRDYPARAGRDEMFRASLYLSRRMDVVEDESIPIDRRDYVSKLRLHALPMTHPLLHLERAQFVGRFGTFGQDYLALAGKLGLETQEVLHERRPTEPIDYRSAFDGDGGLTTAPNMAGPTSLRQGGWCVEGLARFTQSSIATRPAAPHQAGSFRDRRIPVHGPFRPQRGSLLERSRS